MPTFKSFWRDRSGATSIEYALIAGAIMLVIVTVVKLIGVRLMTPFSNAAGNLS